MKVKLFPRLTSSEIIQDIILTDINTYNLVIPFVNPVNILFFPLFQLIKKDRSDLTMVSMVLVITLS